VTKAAEAVSQTHEFYRSALAYLNSGRVEYLVGGAYAMEWITRIKHRTKDLDLFVRCRDLARMLSALRRFGCDTSLPGPHWLSKAVWHNHVIDVIFGAGNGQIAVDDLWFENATAGEAFGVPVRLCPVEESIWMKSFIMERERYDGADVAHFIQARAEQLNWDRLLHRFGSDWPILLSHLILFGYIYPAERRRIPSWVMETLLERALSDSEEVVYQRLCRGGLLSRAQYAVDFEDWDYVDARVRPFGQMTPEDAAVWSAKANATPRVRHTLCPCCTVAKGPTSSRSENSPATLSAPDANGMRTKQ
jgi:hypothetical protein